MIRLLEGVMSYQGGIRAREGNIRPGPWRVVSSIRVVYIRPLDGGDSPLRCKDDLPKKGGGTQHGQKIRGPPILQALGYPEWTKI